MILVVVWDGLRPDMITETRTPYLYAMANQGVTCQASHAAFPTATRINSASLSTGCYPRQHGLVDNELYIPSLNTNKATSCSDWRALQTMADDEGGRLLTVPTLGELLARTGRSMISGGSGSPGTTYLTNPTATGAVVNWAIAWPDAVQAEITARTGGMLPDESTSSERNRFVTETLLDMVPRKKPDVIVLWLTEPDHMQHAQGLASPQALAMLREIDTDLRALVENLKQEIGPEDLDCLLISDHGFTTVAPRLEPEPEHEFVDAGFMASLDSGEIVRALGSLYLKGQARERIGDLVAFLQTRPWLGSLFIRDDLGSEMPHLMPQSAVGGYHPRSAELMLSFRWSYDVNAYGVPGCITHPAPIAGIHGSTSPFAINNSLIAWGPHMKQKVTSRVPCGIVDVAPTILHLLGITPPSHMDGRVLHEVLVDGPAPENMPVSHSTREAHMSCGDGRTRQVAHYSHAGGRRYLDRVTLE